MKWNEDSAWMGVASHCVTEQATMPAPDDLVGNVHPDKAGRTLAVHAAFAPLCPGGFIPRWGRVVRYRSLKAMVLAIWMGLRRYPKRVFVPVLMSAVSVMPENIWNVFPPASMELLSSLMMPS